MMESKWQSADLEVNGLSLHYTRTGGDKPSLLLAHGFSDDGLCWTPVAEALEAFADRPSWEERMRRGMRRDFSWDASAARYAALYRSLEAG